MQLGDLRADVEVRAIRKGQTATFEVDDGFSRKEAPCHGLLVETSTTTLLVPVADVANAVHELRKREPQQARAEGAEPVSGTQVRAIRKGSGRLSRWREASRGRRRLATASSSRRARPPSWSR